MNKLISLGSRPAIPTQRWLVALSAFIINSSVICVYVEPTATATILPQSLTIEQSRPSLPGNLALNRDQYENITLINREFSQQIKNILTEKQLEKLTTTLSKGLTLKLALQNLTLSPEQLNRLRVALRSAQTKIEKVLTTEQLEYIRQLQENVSQQ